MQYHYSPNQIRGFGKWRLVLPLVALALCASAAQADDSRNKSDSRAKAQTATHSGVVNINTASEEELIRLPGVGPSKAKAILALRKRMGKFNRIENLLRVRGIGRKTLRKLHPMLTLKGETTLTAKKSSKKSSTAK
jgi:competence protein ComEA